MTDVQLISGGYLMDVEAYNRLKQIEYEYELLSNSIQALELNRGRQTEELDYWLSPDGGYAKMLERMEQQEREFVERVRANPHQAWRVAGRKGVSD